MTLKDYEASVNKFAADTAEWGGLDPCQQYVAIPNGDWVETCDNKEGGIDVSWAFGLPAGRINCEELYIAAFESERRLADEEKWDDEQRRAHEEKFEDCIANSEGHIFCDQIDAIVNMMDDELREQLYMEISPCTEQKFFDAYCKAHEQKYGEPWELAKANPTW